GLDHDLAPPGIRLVARQVVSDPLREPLGLADVDHPPLGVLEQVNPWQCRQIVDLLAQEAHGGSSHPVRSGVKGYTTTPRRAAATTLVSGSNATNHAVSPRSGPKLLT